MKNLRSQIYSRREARFGTLMQNSPDPFEISPAEYLDRVYGSDGNIQLRNEGEELPRITVHRTRGTPIPEEAEVTLYWPMPIGQVISYEGPNKFTRIEKNVGDWSYRILDFSVDPALTVLLSLIVLKRLPVISVTAIADSSVQVLLRVRAKTMTEWEQRRGELLAILDGLGVKPKDADLSALAPIPGKHPNCDLVYFNDQLGAPLF